MTSEDSQEPRVPRIPRRWLLAGSMFVLFFGMSSVWALSTPLFGAADEQSHAIRAVSIWTGDLAKGKVHINPPILEVDARVPEIYAGAAKQLECWVQKTQLPDCVPRFAGSDRIVTARTTAGLHPPFFYASVGWLGRLVPSARGVYLMRLFGALECSILLASVGLTIADRRWGRLAVVGTVAGMTPLAVSLAGSINPNGLEVAAAVAMWAHGYAFFQREASGQSASRSLVVWFTVSATVLTLTRPLSPLFTLLIGIVLLAVTRLNPVRLLRSRRGIVSIITIGVAGAFSAWWAIYSNHLFYAVRNKPPLGTTAFEGIFGRLWANFLQAIGAFGWLDSGIASFPAVAWITVGVGILLMAYVVGSKAEFRGAVAAFALGTLLPVAAGWPAYETSWVAWQGRYALPLLAGMPLLAALSIERGELMSTQLQQRLARLFAVALVLGNIGGFWWAMKRVTVGVDGPNFWINEMVWRPTEPMPMWMLLAGFVGSAVLGTWGAVKWAGSGQLAGAPSGQPAGATSGAGMQ